MTDSGGRAITRLRSGWYTIFVTVNAAGADFHLAGPSVDSATKAKIPGVALWGIHFLKGTYRYMNDHDTRATTHELAVYESGRRSAIRALRPISSRRLSAERGAAISQGVAANTCSRWRETIFSIATVPVGL